MNSFLSLIKTHKRKFLGLLFLFLLLSNLILPSTKFILAQTGDDPDAGDLITQYPHTDTFGMDNPDKCQYNLTWYKAFAAALIDLILWIPKTIADWSTWLSSYAISQIITWPITNAEKDKTAQVFINGWASVRDLANMLIVLGFVIVGIATALRLREYEAKKFLPLLILVALLVNFSNVFTGLIIDASNITMKSLTMGTSTMGVDFYKDVQKIEKGVACDAIKRDDLGEYASIDILFGFLYLSIAIAFSYLGFMLIARYAVLGILFILSPLAIVFWAFPFPRAKDLWNQWWNQFLKWSFVGVGICFFLGLTRNMLSTFPDLSKDGVTTSTVFFYLLITLITLIVGIKIATKSSALGAGAVMGLAQTAIGFAGGAVMGAAGAGGLAKRLLGKGAGAGAAVGGAAAGATGVSRVTNWAGYKLGQAMEATGLRQKGTTAQRAQAEIAEKTKSIGALGYEGQAKLAKGTALRHEAVKDKVAAIKNLAKEGELSRVGDLSAQQSALAYVESYEKSRGIISTTRKEAIKSNPNLAETPEKMQEAVAKMSPGDFAKNVHQSAYTPELLAILSQDQISQGVFGKNGSPVKRQKIKEAAESSGMATYGQSLVEANKLSEANNLIENIQLIRGNGKLFNQTPPPLPNQNPPPLPIEEKQPQGPGYVPGQGNVITPSTSKDIYGIKGTKKGEKM